jgi:major membrane immunogen (membrane-anchored lipoprotein)
MKKGLSLILFLMIVLTACGTQEKEELKASPDESKTEESANGDKNSENPKELTAEDEKFTKLMVEKDYESVIKESVSLKSEEQKNFYYLASAFKKHSEIQTKSYDETNLNDAQTDYLVIITYLKRAKYVPDEIKDEVNELRKVSEEKAAYYKAEIEKQSTK